MEYEAALRKSWTELAGKSPERTHSVYFLNDNYSVDVENERVLSLSCNVPAKVYTSIIILHYLIKQIEGLPDLKNDWISFKELSGGRGYYPTFKKRVIDTIVRKYKPKPEALFELTGRFKAKKSQLADISIAIEAFDNVPVLITFWKGDEEFGPEANVLFDKNIQDIFCTEDVVVLSEIIAHTI